jgi:leucyl aminopeptidase
VPSSLIEFSPSVAARPIHLVERGGLAELLAGLPPAAAAFARSIGFDAKAGSIALLPGPEGELSGVLFGLGDGPASPLAAGRLPALLPAGVYQLHGKAASDGMAQIAFGLGAYRYERYRQGERRNVQLMLPGNADRAEIFRVVDGVTLARDLVNTPANDLGPAELSLAASDLARRHGATFREVVGMELETGFPMIHAVGKAAIPARAPRLADFTWGRPDHPRVTLVGKGVCFDTGGLDIKSASGMLLMKKDMGGAANVLGLASMIMDAGLPVRLRVLTPTAENAIAGDAFRPGDILRSRKGVSVEIGNTDAEGRLILGDALALAFEEKPELVVDLATLTGAARVALGPDLPAIFTDDDALAAEVTARGLVVGDPVWRLPLWQPYAAMLDSKVADINNTGAGGFAGSITAALFLARFVADTRRWLHGDIYAWNGSAKPGRPEGGDAQAIRALYAMLKARYPA